MTDADRQTLIAIANLLIAMAHAGPQRAPQAGPPPLGYLEQAMCQDGSQHALRAAKLGADR